MDALRRLIVLLLCPALVVAAVVSNPIPEEKGQWVVTGAEVFEGKTLNAANLTIDSGGT